MALYDTFGPVAVLLLIFAVAAAPMLAAWVALLARTRVDELLVDAPTPPVPAVAMTGARPVERLVTAAEAAELHRLTGIN